MTPTPRIARRAGAVALLLAAAYLLLPTSLGGGTTYVTTTGDSMQPRFHTGDLAILRPADSYAVGDIVAFHSDELDTVVMHRIVARDGYRFITQGDNNDWLDPDEPTADEMIGKLWFGVPGAGKAVDTVQSPWLVGSAALAALAVVGPRRPRSRRRRRSAPRGSGRTALPTSFSPSMRGLARQTALGAGLVALVSVVGLVAVPLLPQAAAADVDPTGVSHQGRWDYTGTARTSTTYPDGRIGTGDPVYTRLADSITVSFADAVRGSGVADVTGALRLDVSVAGADQWSAGLASGSAVALQDGAATASVVVDTAQALALLDRHAAEIGVQSAGGTVVVTPVLEGTGSVDGAVFALAAPAALSFSLDSTALRLADGTESLTSSGSIEVAGTSAADSGSVAFLGRSVPVQPVRLLLAGVLAVALLALAAAGWVARSPRGGAADGFLVRHSARIVPVESFVSTGTVIDVSDAEALYRVAERLDTVVLHHTTALGDVFAVQDGDTTFRHLARRTIVATEGRAPWFAGAFGRRFA